MSQSSQNPSTNSNKSNALKDVQKYDVSAELMQQCLNTSLYELTRMHPFVGSTLQIMTIMYTYALPTAGVTFNADMKKFELYINPAFFCLALDSKQRVAVLIHEMAHILNKHLIRIPFMRVSDHKRQLLNIAGDLSINQTIQHLPRGCSQCPPIEEQKTGSSCTNELCPGMCLDVNDFYDETTDGKRVAWPKNQPLEIYFEKLMERYEEEPEDEEDNSKRLLVSLSSMENLDVTASGSKRGKTLTFNGNGDQKIDDRTLTTGQNVLVKDQTDPRDNGVYVVTNAGTNTSPCVLTRLDAHDGHDAASEVKGGDMAVPRLGTENKGKFFAVKADSDHILDVDAESMEWVETQAKSGNGKGKPRQFDVHDWHANAEESEVLDATEELVKRAMVKQSMSYDNLPSSVRELLDSIKQRRAELNYKALILAAIKRSASGHNRAYSWTRRSRRFGNKAPGTKDGNLPKLSLYLDTSGSISVEELSSFLCVVDEFLKVGSRTCEINLFSDVNYYTSKYKLADRSMQDQIKKSVNMGGTCLESSLKKIHETGPDLAIFLTDGYYADVPVEEWMRAGEKFPQVLWVISSGGTEDHPLKRLGNTVKIVK
jgi:predicted metal-dependent peptidase